MKNTSSYVKDIYKELASRIFGVPVNEVTPEQQAQARCCTFGYRYGHAGPPRKSFGGFSE
ncbi:hypothetical protein fBA2_005 [Acinetobacter virus fBenAci002]|uniref:Uncharacterized protein n=1 Tax=Acinetobacter virus fBenAci002 TaxID=2781369 RepID=A0A7S6RBU0_9CAUD|nr:hypothetical protein fBA2_005 [Acinetobacter virus fBenAci002]